MPRAAFARHEGLSQLGLERGLPNIAEIPFHNTTFPEHAAPSKVSSSKSLSSSDNAPLTSAGQEDMQKSSTSRFNLKTTLFALLLPPALALSLAYMSLGTRYEALGRFLVGQAYMLKPAPNITVRLDGVPLMNVAAFKYTRKGNNRLVLLSFGGQENDLSLLNLFPNDLVVGHSGNTGMGSVVPLGRNILIMRDMAWPVAPLGLPIKSPFLATEVSLNEARVMRFEVKTECKIESCLAGGAFVPLGKYEVLLD